MRGAWEDYMLHMSQASSCQTIPTASKDEIVHWIINGQPYSSALAFIRYRLAFSLINSAIACPRAPRSAYHAPAMEISLSDNPLDLIRAEAQLSD